MFSSYKIPRLELQPPVSIENTNNEFWYRIRQEIINMMIYEIEQGHTLTVLAYLPSENSYVQKRAVWLIARQLYPNVVKKSSTTTTKSNSFAQQWSHLFQCYRKCISKLRNQSSASDTSSYIGFEHIENYKHGLYTKLHSIITKDEEKCQDELLITNIIDDLLLENNTVDEDCYITNVIHSLHHLIKTISNETTQCRVIQFILKKLSELKSWKILTQLLVAMTMT